VSISSEYLRPLCLARLRRGHEILHRLAGIVCAPESRQLDDDTEWFGEPDEIRQDLPDEVTVRIAPQEVCSQACKPVDEIEFSECRAVPAVDTRMSLIEAAQGTAAALAFSDSRARSYLPGRSAAAWTAKARAGAPKNSVALGSALCRRVRRLPARCAPCAQPPRSAVARSMWSSATPTAAFAQGLGMPSSARCWGRAGQPGGYGGGSVGVALFYSDGVLLMSSLGDGPRRGDRSRPRTPEAPVKCKVEHYRWSQACNRRLTRV
jgi:hypothetical protein